MKNLLALSLFALFFASCSNLSPFTKSLYEKHDWSEDELQSIQFYTSEDIELHRAIVDGEESQIVNGEIKIVDGKEVDVVRIPKGTPGVMEFKAKGNHFAVRFEDNKEQFLMFGPNPKYGNRYMLLAKKWQGRRGTVTYEGQQYRLSSSSGLATLMVNLKKLENNKVKSRTAKGVKVGN